ncbi:MAG: UbiA family prenyltransferase [Bacteroidetes bacterium]|nr:UbiA family prenyltransferase [Bacteroidota bacterium]
MSTFFKLIRVQNLAFIALTQFLFRYCIFLPLTNQSPISPLFSNFDFIILMLSTIIVAAGGYAINDYFDVHIDKVNKPLKVIIGKKMLRRHAVTTHSVLTIIAIVLGAYVSFEVGSIMLVFFNIIMCTLLWLYSARYKASFLLGNIIVSFSSAATIFVVWLFEMYALKSSELMDTANLTLLNFFLCCYVIFAFIISLIREIVKDAEDIEGDKKGGCRTLPIVWGYSKTKKVLFLLIGFAIIALSFLSYLSYVYNLKIVFWYVNITLILALIYTTYVIYVAKNKDDYTFLSGLLKFIMFAGIFSMALVTNW